MSIALITLNASYNHSSLSLRTLHQALRDNGLDAVRIEGTIKDKRLAVLSRLYDEAADIYAFSCYLWNKRELEELAQKIKALRPEATVLFGGPEVSFLDEEYFHTHPYVDLILSGEGEELLPALCREILKDGRDAVLSRGRIRVASRFEGFSSSPFPLKEDPIERPIAYYESSRGCPYACAYCLSSIERGVRAKPVETVLEELSFFEEMKQVKIVKLVDRTFNFDGKRARAIWRGLLSERYTKTYHFEICAELIDNETLDLLRRFPKGKIQLEAGVQSTHAPTLEAVDRKGSIKGCLENLKRLKALGNIHIHADLIAGLPKESLTEFRHSFDDVYPVCHQLQLGFLKLLRGSPLADKKEEYRLVTSETPPYEVLKTADLSFEELRLLHRIEAVLERFGNSGSFAYTMEAVERRIASPFDFWRSLAEELPSSLDGLSQRRCFELLKEHCRPLFSPDDLPELSARLRIDFYRTEAGSCPPFLNNAEELNVLPASKAMALFRAGKKGQALSTEVHRFSFDKDAFYVIDRKEKTVTRIEAALS